MYGYAFCFSMIDLSKNLCYKRRAAIGRYAIKKIIKKIFSAPVAILNIMCYNNDKHEIDEVRYEKDTDC